jgi:hypothetical protein
MELLTMSIHPLEKVLLSAENTNFMELNNEISSV